MSALPVLRAARAAFVFMTRIPVGGFPYASSEFRWASAYFPLVGLVVGLFGAATFVLARPLGALIAALLSVLMTVWVTGAFHEDGLADSMDALGGSHSKKKLHEILKDSRIGTYGGSALVLSLLLRVLLLSELPSDVVFLASGSLSVPLSLVLVHTLSRTGPVFLMATLNYAASEGAKGASVASGDHKIQALLAGLFATGLVAALWFVGLEEALALALLMTTGIVTALTGRVWKRRAGGFTGDFLGATEQFLEMGLLLVLVFGAKANSGVMQWPAWL